jgi:antibiotic biosynthesis monooxygenase (ABM) superfamily enzyme
MRRLSNSFAGWFPSEGPDREPPTTLKQSMVVLLVLFPIVMEELRFLTPLLKKASFGTRYIRRQCHKCGAARMAVDADRNGFPQLVALA